MPGDQAREDGEALESVTVKHVSCEQAGHIMKKFYYREKLTTKFSFQWDSAMVVKIVFLKI